VALKPLLRPKRRLNFFKRNGRLFSIVGALIVFTTFIVKDAIREQFKESLDAMTVAHDVSILRGDTEGIESLLMNLSMSEEDRAEKILNREPRVWEYWENELKTSLSSLQWEEWRASSVLIRSRALASRIGVDIKASSEIKGIEESLRTLEPDHMKIVEYYYSVRDEHELNQENLTQVQMERRDKEMLRERIVLLKVSDFAQSIVKRSEVLQESLLKDAENQTAKDEAAYRICTWFSYGLYVLGWSLALAGRLFSVEGLVTGGD